jgi:transcriptional regulator with XRE-family HTH domain
MRLGLTQEEVAYLLGAVSGTKVCRYERFAREPLLRTALAYEAIFQRPIRELFTGMYEEIEQEIAERAKALLVKAGHMKAGNRAARKREAFAKIAATKSKKTQNP